MSLKPPFDRITIEPGEMGGQPCIRGMQITVRRVLEILAAYPDRAELFQDYPDLKEEDLRQAPALAAPPSAVRSINDTFRHVISSELLAS